MTCPISSKALPASSTYCNTYTQYYETSKYTELLGIERGYLLQITNGHISRI
jgi:hypothetical protein